MIISRASNYFMAKFVGCNLCIIFVKWDKYNKCKYLKFDAVSFATVLSFMQQFKVKLEIFKMQRVILSRIGLFSHSSFPTEIYPYNMTQILFQ